MRSAQKNDGYYTYEDYCSWDDDERLELIDGKIYVMSPAPLRIHQKIVMNLSAILFNFLKDKPCEVYSAPFDVRLNADTDDNTVVQPDIVVICDQSKLTDKGCVGVPDLIIEVLSPSSVVNDKVVKFKAYREAGVREYWVVDPENSLVLVNLLDRANYTTHPYYGDSACISVSVLEGCVIDLKDVFYDNLTLSPGNNRPERGILEGVEF